MKTPDFSLSLPLDHRHLLKSLWAVLVGNRRSMIHHHPDKDTECGRENNYHAAKGKAELSTCSLLRSARDRPSTPVIV